MGEEDKKYHIILTDGYTYTGTIKTIDDFFIIIIDKFGEEVSLNKKEISVIKGAKF